MYCVKICRVLVLLTFVSMLFACQDVSDDITPSGEDKRADIEEGVIGHLPGQIAPDFTADTSLSEPRTLSTEVAMSTDGLLIYFTMWCPTCDSHMSHIRSNILPDFPDVSVLVVDWVTGAVSASRASQLANGFTSFTVLVDVDHTILNAYDGGMGTTVIVDPLGVVRFNETYKDGRKVREVLESL